MAVFFFFLIYQFSDVQLSRKAYRTPHRIQVNVTGSDPFFLQAVPGHIEHEIAPYNLAPDDRKATPLFIPFTRNYKLLEQAVASYVSAGWPREEIIVVDNSGVMDANVEGLLTRDNPFFLDYEKLLRGYGVNVLRTPAMLTFSQLQNYYINQALIRKWPYFFWSHQDVVLLSDEKTLPYKSAYRRLVMDLDAFLKSNEEDPEKWAIRWYHFDWLTLVNTAAMRDVGAWDNFIPYHQSDCDFYSRLAMKGKNSSDGHVGMMFDMGKQIENMEELFFPAKDENEVPGQPRFMKLFHALRDAQSEKNEKPDKKNEWQDEQKGGVDEPWSYNAKGFHSAWSMMSSFGEELYLKKWGTNSCALKRKPEDAWKEVI